MEMIELGKKYRTRDGREVRIYAIEAAGIYPVHGAVRSINGFWCSRMWNHSGRMQGHGGKSQVNGQLVEVLPEATFRLNAVLASDGTLRICSDASVWAVAAEKYDFYEHIGQIDITHNGKEITDVKVVK